MKCLLPLYLVCGVVFLLGSQNKIKAQVREPDTTYWAAAESSNRPLLVVVAEASVFTAWRDLLSSHQREANYNVLLLRDTSQLDVFCRRVNRVLNQEVLNKKRIYFLQVLTAQEQAKYTILDQRIFVAKRWIEPGSVSNLSQFDPIWQGFKTHALWTYDVEKIEDQSRVVERKKRVEGGIGLSLGTTINTFQTTAEGMPDGLRFLTYTGYRRVYPRWLFNFSVDVGVNLPNPRRILQDQIFGQIDVFSLINGGEVEIKLDTEISGYLAAGMGAGLAYLLPQKGKNTPYFGLDLRMFGGNFLYTKIDTTIIIDSSNGFSGGGGGFDLSDQEGDFTPTTFFYLTLSPNIGMFRQLGERWLLDLNAAYHPDPGSWNGDDEYFSFLRFRMGLRYRFIGKRTTRYEYVKIVAAP